MSRLLLVEDRENLRNLLAQSLRAGFDVDAVGDGPAALKLLHEERYAVVITDVRLPVGSGEEVLAAARALDVPPEVILMTGFAEVPAAVAALKAGAWDYLAKPVEPEELLRSARRAAERHALLQRTRELEAAIAGDEGPLVGRSPVMMEVRRLIGRLGRLPVPVLLVGESGTGKEMVAREIHRMSGHGAFIAVNCSSLSEPTLETELFGLADQGTLFLDEVGDLPQGLQVKLNRALEEGEVRRAGESQSRPIQIRLIAATHLDLERAVAEGRFRAELYFRLKVMQIRLPPLRERRGDLPLLVARFLHITAARYGTPARRLAPEALAALEAWPWPGNVRELRHAIEHAAVMADGEVIEVAHLPDELHTTAPTAQPGTYREAVERAQEQAGREYLLGLLRRVNGNVSQAAREAGVERETMHRLLRRHTVDPGRFRHS